MKKIIVLFMSMMFIFTLYGCGADDHTSNTAVNTHKNLQGMINDSKISFESKEQSRKKVDTNQRLLNSYLKSVNNDKSYTFEYVMAGLGDDNQLQKTYRTQSQDNFFEEEISNADDPYPDVKQQYVYLEETSYFYLSDGKNPPKTEKSKKPSSKEKVQIFSDVKYSSTFQVQIDGNEYVCEVWIRSNNAEFEYYFLDDELIGIKWLYSRFR